MPSWKPLRAVLYVPASNAKALVKAPSLPADAVIYDLEDSVAPEMKHTARNMLRDHMAVITNAKNQIRAVRINALSTDWGHDDLKLAVALKADAIVLPKAETPQQIIEAARLLDACDAPDNLTIWAMIESPRGILNADEIAQLGQRSAARLQCFIVGSNDIALNTGVKTSNQRRALIPWIMQIILAARAGKLDVLDGVYNDFRDQDGFNTECEQGAELGFDGKTLIHPAQIEGALAVYSSSPQEINWAHQVIDSFNLPENQLKGAIALNGAMVERLHIKQAERILARKPAQT